MAACLIHVNLILHDNTVSLAENCCPYVENKFPLTTATQVPDLAKPLSQSLGLAKVSVWKTYVLWDINYDAFHHIPCAVQFMELSSLAELVWMDGKSMNHKRNSQSSGLIGTCLFWAMWVHRTQSTLRMSKPFLLGPIWKHRCYNLPVTDLLSLLHSI